MLTHRLVPAQGAFPRPGESVRDAPWARELGTHDVALFCCDASTGAPFTLSGRRAQGPLQEYAVVYPTRRAGEIMMRRLAARDPRLRVSLYDRHGRPLATASQADGPIRLGASPSRTALQFVMVTVAGAAGYLVATARHPAWFGGGVGAWATLPPHQRLVLVASALGAGAGSALLLILAQRVLLAGARARAARPMSPAQRERLYTELAKRPVALVPEEITLQPTVIVWSDPMRYAPWERALGGAACARLGRYRIPELGVQIEFWIDDADELTVTVIDHPSAGMWLTATTRYDDGTTYSAANLKTPGVDQNPRFRTDYRGAAASAEDVMIHARDDRPPGPRRHPTPDNVLDDYRTGWRDAIRWRRERGVTADEYRRADAARQARAATA